MRRFIGWVLVVHAFAHSFAGVSHRVSENMWAYVPWMIAVVGYLVAALGVFRLPVLRRHWKAALLIATIASLHLLVWYRPAWTMPGLFVDLVIFVAVLGVQQPRIDADIDTMELVGRSAVRHPHVLETLWGFGVLALVYVVVVLATRPTSLRWGTTRAEREAMLPGDQVFPADAGYRIDHAITVHASPSAVWPWLVQLGQDRGGFYSYDWLENWGTFVLQPIDSTTTRLIVRTRGEGSTSALVFALAPVNVFVFEPAHFIMERAMLRGIRARVERTQS